ncbi:MAG: DUF1624 domain-containing protein [Bacilli bacterium]|nr:DUF1624 domain-containing protein [Bacilli bacterium]
METTKSNNKVSPFEKRIHEIDFFRGLLIIVVILDHLFNLLMSYNKGWMGADCLEPYNTIYNIFHWYWTCTARQIIRPVCLTAFCFISGISCAFSKNNWKRAIEMVIFWAVIFLGSSILDILNSNYHFFTGVNGMRIDINIIGVLAFSNLLYCFVQKKSWEWLVLIIAIGLGVHIIVATIGLCYKDLDKIYFPFLWKPNKELYPMGDHMPFVPYVSFFFGGALLSYFTYSKTKKSYFRKFEFERPICFLGRHTLIIYLSHFLILLGIFTFVDLFI